MVDVPWASTRPSCESTCACARDDLLPLRDDSAFDAHAARVDLDGTRKICLGFDRGIADAWRQQRMAGACGRAIDQRQRPAAVYHAHRIQHVRTGFAFEYGEAIANLDQTVGKRFRNGRLRHAAVDGGLQQLFAIHGGDLLLVGEMRLGGMRMVARHRRVIENLGRLLAGRFGKHNLKHEQPSSHHNRAVGDVEGGPLVRTDIEEEKIDDVTADDAIP